MTGIAFQKVKMKMRMTAKTATHAQARKRFLRAVSFMRVARVTCFRLAGC